MNGRWLSWGAVCVVAIATAQTPEDCHEHYRRGRLAAAERCFAELIRSGDPYYRAEGHWGLGEYQEANEAFRLAVERQPRNAHYRVRWGRLYLDHYQPADAAQLFKEALEIDPRNAQAFLGLALVAAEEFQPRAEELAQRAVLLDPQLVEAHELLALLALEDGDEELARRQALRTVERWPDAVQAMAVLATIEWLHDRDATEWEKKILQVNPACGQAYAIAARIFVLNRRYGEAIRLYRRALELNPKLWRAREQLGINLMRLGHDGEAREHLEVCYRAGYRSPAVVNTLRLLDSYRNFETVATTRARLQLHRKEAQVLQAYFRREVERALSTYEQRYQLRLDAPVRIEVYPDHEDFAVRTLGMPGLGALGVTFGSVVAMDSPSAKQPGTYNWASTLWHELNHVIVLALSRHRAPRWFVEGMAVYEENRASPYWVEPLEIRMLQAIQERRLLPILELDRGFIRPQYPAQVAVSYFQAGKACAYIDERWGFDKLLAMAREFATGATTAEVLQRVLGVTPAEFDQGFWHWLDQKVGPMVRAFDSWRQGMKELLELRKQGLHERVLEQGRRVRDLYPDYVEQDSAYEILAETYLAMGARTEAIEELKHYAARGGHDPAVLKKLARLQQEAGDVRGAAETLERLLYWIPTQDQELHSWLGELYEQLGEQEEALREYQVWVAMGPVDPAGAYYKLARVYAALGRREDALEQVIRALEIAPGFRQAQELLLKLTEQGNAAERRGTE